MNKKVKIDQLFDGHLEKSISTMTYSERMDYLIMLMDLRYISYNAMVIKNENSKLDIKQSK